MPISVIVSNFNGANYLPRLLQTLRAQQGVILEIIVVDRYSSDESMEILAQHSDVKVISEPPESGLVAGYAAGVPHARHDKLFFCNEDMWFPPDCLRLVEEQLAANPKIGAVMPYQVRYDGTALVNTGIWFGPSRWHRGVSYPFRAWICPVVNRPVRVSCVNAGACMLSRVAYADVGGWDVSFFLDHEDDDLAIRLWQKGWECWVQPCALVFHAVGASNSKTLGKKHTRVGIRRYISQHSNLVVIVLKYFSVRWWWLVPLLWLDTVARNCGRARFRTLLWDFKAAFTTLSRLPSVLRFRHHWRVHNRRRPGENFFRVDDFQVHALSPAVRDSVETLIGRALLVREQL